MTIFCDSSPVLTAEALRMRLCGLDHKRSLTKKNFSRWQMSVSNQCRKTRLLSCNLIRKTDTMNPQIYALKIKLNAMKDDLHNMAFSEFPLDALVAQSNKIRALKAKITKMENAR